MRIFLTTVGLLTPFTTAAHGFGHQQIIDLSLPQHLYMLSATFAIILSFLLIAVFLRSHESALWSPQKTLLWLRVPRTPVLHIIAALLCIALIVIGWKGSQDVQRNILPNVVWVIFNIGFVYFTMLIGNVWPIMHPFAWWRSKRTVHAWPAHYSVWPAVLLFFVYRWLENVHPAGQSPKALALLVVLYGVMTIGGVHRYGKDAWLRYGDPFGVFFRLIGLFAIADISEETKKVTLRLPGAGLFRIQAAHFSEVVFVMLMLGTIAFDGLKETQFWHGVLQWIAMGGDITLFTKTIGMLLVIASMLFVYMLSSLLSELFSGREGHHRLPYCEYAFALLPIAVGYEIAHYIFFFLTEGQTFLVLLSDPMGTGMNIFGMAKNTIVYDLLEPETLWNIQMIVIVLGHVMSVYIAHLVALRLYKKRFMALRSQFPMLLLMIGYTVFSLWTITLPTVITVE